MSNGNPDQTADYWLANCSACGAVGPDYCRLARCEDQRYVEGGEREVNAAFNDSPGVAARVRKFTPGKIRNG